MKRCFQLLIGSFILVLISGCGSGESVIPSITPSLTSTITPTPILFTSTPSLPGRITGRVVNSAGEPLAGVGIKLLKKRNLVTETKTGADGNFTFENVPAGKYTIGYDYFPEGGFTIHYFSDEFEVQSEMTSQQDYVIKVQ